MPDDEEDELDGVPLNRRRHACQMEPIPLEERVKEEGGKIGVETELPNPHGTPFNHEDLSNVGSHSLPLPSPIGS